MNALAPRGLIALALLASLAAPAAAAPERPQLRSVIEEGEQHTPYGSGRSIHLTTLTLPLPRDSGDKSVGPLVYHWDFGPLHGVDNGDGTAIILTDKPGSYDITVSCEQRFAAASGVTYVERTLTSE